MPSVVRARASWASASYVAGLALSFAWLGGCADAAPTHDPQAEAESFPLQGKLEVIVVEGAQGATRYFLEPEDGSERLELEFADAPKLGSGARVGLRGEPWGGKLRVQAMALRKVAPGAFGSERVGSARQPLAAEERARTIGFALIDFNGDGLNLTKEKAQSFMFSTTNAGPLLGLDAGDKSVVQYYQETSFGQLKVSGGVETGLTWNKVACNGNGDGELVRSLRDKITTDYDHYIWYYGSEQPNCGYGWGSLGTWDRPTGDIWFNGDLFDGAITHEFGHNMGYQHASSIKCSGTPLANDPLTCQTTEYGSTISVMGNLSNGHMMAIEKWYSGWFEGCNGVKVRSSGTFTLHAIEKECGGVQALQIPMPVTNRRFSTEQSNGNNPARYYYLEFRAGGGLDTGMTPAVMVHASDDIQPPDEVCARSVLMDMNPASNQVNGMVAGSTFTDPAGGVTFSVTSIAAGSAVVNVTLSAAAQPNTCMDGTTLVGSGPATCAGGSGGSGGTGGGGTAGTGGSGGTGGNGGVATGGTSGSGGAGGNSAGASTGGTSTAGAGGTATAGGGSANGGSAGGGNAAGGSAGSAPVAGSGGAASGGVPSMAGTPPVSGASPSTPAVAPPSEDSGCGCAVPGSRSPTPSHALLLLAPLAALLSRRRRARA